MDSMGITAGRTMGNSAAIVDGEHRLRIHVGERLRMARVLRNISQTELGAVINVSGRSVQHYESGEREIPLVALLRFCIALGVPIEKLVTVDQARELLDAEHRD